MQHRANRYSFTKYIPSDTTNPLNPGLPDRKGGHLNIKWNPIQSSLKPPHFAPWITNSKKVKFWCRLKDVCETDASH